MAEKVRTRFAPSPTGYMHVGNLRTALYTYLYAKHCNGDFILRIEDTDQKRYVEGATDVIYNTLRETGLIHDEGPDKDKGFGPYIQSERKDIYKKYATMLVESGHAYYCFCEGSDEESSEEQTFGYNRKCRNLSKQEIQEKLNSGCSYVIRQKIPLDGTTTFHDEIYGDITVKNDTLDDQVLLKSDGLPTYNFANVVDDYLMQISHVMRGKEYISSTPKYQLLYEAFGWKSPKTVHLSTIMGMNADGSVSKLSKRHGAVSFAQLQSDGYLAQAILNYIALLGWSPKDTQEIFTKEELVEKFSLEGICKTDAIFDYKKLDWVNSIYIKNLPFDEFLKLSMPYVKDASKYVQDKWKFAATLAQSRINKFSDIKNLFEFLDNYLDFDLELFNNKKNKLNLDDCYNILMELKPNLDNIKDWSCENINTALSKYAEDTQQKIGRPMWAVRIAATGSVVTPGGAAEMMYLLGKDETMRRINRSIERLKA